MPIDLVRSNLVSVTVESILFGIFSVLFTLSLYLLLYKKTVSRPLGTRFACALSFMYILATTHEGINFRRALDGFTTGPGGTQKLSNNNGGVDICKLAIYAVQSLLGDILMLYRLGIVCRGYWSVMIPSIALMTAGLVSGVAMLVAFSKQQSASPFASMASLAMMIAFFASSLVITLGGTIAITVRIWSARRKVSSSAMTELSPVTVVLLDPAIVYSASLLSLLFVFSARSYAVIMILDWIPQIVGIVASLVIVRIGFKRLWNGRLDFTPRRLDKPPEVPPKDDVWLAGLAKRVGSGSGAELC